MTPGARDSTTLRLLLPVAASIVLVALLIANGIRANRERVGAYVDSQREALAFMRRFQTEAVEYLRARQNIDGSWSTGRQGDAASNEPDVDGTLRILLNVRRAGWESEPLFVEGLRFARARSDRARRSPLGQILLTDRPVADAPTRGGGDASPGAPAGPPSDLALGVLRLGTLPPAGEEAARLLASIQVRLRSAPPPAPAWLGLGYLATLATQSGSPAARALLPELLEGFRARVGPDPWNDLDNVALAAYVELVARECRAHDDPCQDGNRALAALVERRRPDGSWAAGALVGVEGARVGSDWEATSLGLAAIAAFEEVLRHRFGL